MDLKFISYFRLPSGAIKPVAELTEEERILLVRTINSAPARALGYEYEWVS